MKRVNVEKIIPDIRVSSTNVTTTVTPAVYSLGHIGAGGSAIAAAASQAIAATQQVNMSCFKVIIFFYYPELILLK